MYAFIILDLNKTYLKDIREILKIRSSDELIEMEDEALDFLLNVAIKTSLR
jgi:DNA helicase TIP49 (TBP-interacting protein)